MGWVISVTNSDFVSLDGSDLTLPRKTDGSLPDINFLRLAEGSDLIDAGVNVGLTYIGANPDLGPFEFQNGTVVIPNPTFISASIANVSPSLLTLTYDITLNNSVIPAASSFSVIVNSQARTVNSVSISDKKVNLTLSSAVKSGETVTVSYTKPTTNPLQASTGKEAASISAQAVKNNTISPVNTAPSVAITSPGNNSTFTTPTNITITASASDTDGTIALVEFYNGTTLLGSDAASPYSFTWSNVPEGTFSMTATATDNNGSKTISPAISVTVSKETIPPVANRLPSVTISNPIKGIKFFNPADIEIEVIASDPDGTSARLNYSMELKRLQSSKQRPIHILGKVLAQVHMN